MKEGRNEGSHIENLAKFQHEKNVTFKITVK